MAESNKTSRREELEEFVSSRIYSIQRAYLKQDRSTGAAWLAELRKAKTKPGSSPMTWTLEFEGFPESLIGMTDDPSWGEWAAHLAFTLYAIHQQSQTEPMHRRGKEYGLGRAVARLDMIQRQQSDSAPSGKLPSRFAALATASTFEEISHYSRQLIVQLRDAGIPLDYGRLAGQFYLLQNPMSADDVRLAWGRDFAGVYASTNQPTTSDQKED